MIITNQNLLQVKTRNYYNCQPELSQLKTRIYYNYKPESMTSPQKNETITPSEMSRLKITP